MDPVTPLVIDLPTIAAASVPALDNALTGAA
jgi:hypothetical protein